MQRRHESKDRVSRTECLPLAQQTGRNGAPFPSKKIRCPPRKGPLKAPSPLTECPSMAPEGDAERRHFSLKLRTFCAKEDLSRRFSRPWEMLPDAQRKNLRTKRRCQDRSRRVSMIVKWGMRSALVGIAVMGRTAHSARREGPAIHGRRAHGDAPTLVFFGAASFSDRVGARTG